MTNVLINSKMGDYTLKPYEAMHLNATNTLLNANGYQIDLTSLTAVSKSVTEQKFFTLAPSTYMPVIVGENPFAVEILKYRSYSVGDDFETGVVGTGGNNTRLAETDVAIDTIRIPVANWAKTISWSVFDLQQASRSGNWDLVAEKEKGRKKLWDIGIQKLAFVGSQTISTQKGLLTQTAVTANTSVITGYIKSMNSAAFNTFAQTIIGIYRQNCNFTAMPTHFIIPELDFTGLASFPDSTYPLKTKLELLTDAFKIITMNPNFKILPCAYADTVNNASFTGLNKNVYTLLNYDEDSVSLQIPLNYTNTIANTLNGIQFQNGAIGQFSGVLAYRPKEMLYFTF